MIEAKKAVHYIWVYSASYPAGEPKPLDGTAAVEWLEIDKIRKLNLTPMTLEIIESCL